MERIFLGLHFANENVKESFLDAARACIDNMYSVNEYGKLFEFVKGEQNDTYGLYELPLKEEASISEPKLSSIIYVLDDGWVDFDDMFKGFEAKKCENIVLLYCGNEYDLNDFKISCEIAAQMNGVNVKCLAKQISLESILDGDINETTNLINLFSEIKECIHQQPFVINNILYTQESANTVKCSGEVASGFIEKGDRVSLFSRGGEEVRGKITHFFAFSANPMLNGKKGQKVRFTLSLEKDAVIKGNLIQAISTDRVRNAKKFNALITMYAAEFDGYRTLDYNTMIEFHMLGKGYGGRMEKEGLGQLEDEFQMVKTLSSGRADTFTFSLYEEAPLVVGMTFILEKPWDAPGEPATYGHGTIVEIME